MRVDSAGDGAALRRAQEAVRDLIATERPARIRVLVPAGRYGLDAPLRFGPEDVGPVGSRVDWVADGEVTLCSTTVPAPLWEAAAGGIVRTRLEPGLDFDQLIIGDRRRILARYPNHDPDARLQGFAADALDPARVRRWRRPEGGYVRGLHDYEWGGNSYRIVGRRGDDLDLEWAGDNQRGSALHPTYRMVENLAEELDAPGEWFYDRASGWLSYLPEPGEDLAGVDLALGTLPELIRCAGESPDRPLSGLGFDGFTLTGTHRALFGAVHEPLLLGDWTIVRRAAVHLRNVADVRIVRCRFREVGGNAVLINGYARDVRIERNEFHGSGASDICVLGLPSAVRSPSVWGAEQRTLTDDRPGPAGEDYPRDIVIMDNHLSAMGRYAKQSAGVQISMARRVSVLGNTIHDGPRAGINVNDGTWGGHVIARNDLYRLVRETGDHGPINAWGRDRFWSLDDVTDRERRRIAALDALEPTMITHNRIQHDHDWGVDLDDGSTNYRIEHNLFLGCGVKLREGFDRAVRSNVFVGGGVHSHVSYAGNGDEVIGNLFLTRVPYFFIRADPRHSGIRYDQNLFWNDGDPIDVIDQAWRDAGQDQHSTIADPGLVHSPWRDPALTEIALADASWFPDGAPGPGDVIVGAAGIRADRPPIDWARPPGDFAPPAEVDWLGLTLSAIWSPALASSLGLYEAQGAYVQVAPADSAGAALGLRAGDVVQAVDDQAVNSPADLPTSDTHQRRLRVWRDQRPLEVAIEPTESSSKSRRR